MPDYRNRPPVDAPRVIRVTLADVLQGVAFWGGLALVALLLALALGLRA